MDPFGSWSPTSAASHTEAQAGPCMVASVECVCIDYVGRAHCLGVVVKCTHVLEPGSYNCVMLPWLTKYTMWLGAQVTT